MLDRFEVKLAMQAIDSAITHLGKATDTLVQGNEKDVRERKDINEKSNDLSYIRRQLSDYV